MLASISYTEKCFSVSPFIKSDSECLEYESLPVTSMLVTKCVSDNYTMLVTVLAILVTNIHYLFTLASGINIQKMSLTSKFCHQHPKIVTNFKLLTSRCHQHHCHHYCHHLCHIRDMHCLFAMQQFNLQIEFSLNYLGLIKRFISIQGVTLSSKFELQTV